MDTRLAHHFSQYTTLRYNTIENKGRKSNFDVNSLQVDYNIIVSHTNTIPGVVLLLMMLFSFFLCTQLYLSAVITAFYYSLPYITVIINK